MNDDTPKPYLYIFLDEGGNFDFSPKGTQYFTITSLTATRPFAWDAALMSLKYDELERGSGAEYFHASEDKQIVRNRVFATIATHMDAIRLDSIIVPKRKIVPELRPPEKFYPRMLGYLLRYVIQREPLDASTEVLAMTDVVPMKARQKAIAKGVEEALTALLPAGVRYRVLHHDSKSCISLQVADYCNWAIYRKWDRGDERSYNVIRSAIRSEFEIFKRSNRLHY